MQTPTSEPSTYRALRRVLTAAVAAAALVGAVLVSPGERSPGAEAAGSLRGEVCGTWVLQQVMSANQLEFNDLLTPARNFNTKVCAPLRTGTNVGSPTSNTGLQLAVRLRFQG